MICGMIFFLFSSPEKMSDDYYFEPLEAMRAQGRGNLFYFSSTALALP